MFKFSFSEYWQKLQNYYQQNAIKVSKLKVLCNGEWTLSEKNVSITTNPLNV